DSRDYWLRKIRRNMQRDCRATAALVADGWRVIRLWESEVRADVEGSVARVLAARAARELAAAPAKTFAEFFAGIGLMRLALENVAGFLNSNRGRDFEQALLALNGLGYEVDAFILDAVHFVPQSRQRLFVVGHRAGAGCSGDAAESDVRPRSLIDFMANHPRI